MKTRARTYAACLGAVLMLASCSPFASEPPWKLAVLTTNASSYQPGDLMSATLRNYTGAKVSFGACPFVLERRVRDAWAPVPPFAPGDCDGSLHTLDHLQRTTIDFSLLGAFDGTYRLRMDIARDGVSSGTSVRSPAFHVSDEIPDFSVSR